jgi:uncharacterized membrane protein YheB (UPF0754 family)
MNYWLLFIPFISALTGWCITCYLIFLFFHPVKCKKIAGFTLQGFLLKNQSSLAEQVARYASSQISFRQIEEKITQPDTIEKMMPFVEKEMDYFLRIRMAEQMPVISSFIGEKTITQLKTVFTEELKTLFPQLISNYISTIQPGSMIETAIAQKIATIPPGLIENKLRFILKEKLKVVQLLGVVTGFFIGLLQVMVTFILSR